MTKAPFLHAAEVFDSWRVVPRLIVFFYGLFVYKVTFFILVWYSSEPPTARGVEESAVVGVVVTAVTGFAPLIYKVYSDSGRDWTKPPVDDKT